MPFMQLFLRYHLNDVNGHRLLIIKAQHLPIYGSFGPKIELSPIFWKSECIFFELCLLIFDFDLVVSIILTFKYNE